MREFQGYFPTVSAAIIARIAIEDVSIAQTHILYALSTLNVSMEQIEMDLLRGTLPSPPTLGYRRFCTQTIRVALLVVQSKLLQSRPVVDGMNGSTISKFGHLSASSSPFLPQTYSNTSYRTMDNPSSTSEASIKPGFLSDLSKNPLSLSREFGVSSKIDFNTTKDKSSDSIVTDNDAIPNSSYISSSYASSYNSNGTLSTNSTNTSTSLSTGEYSAPSHLMSGFASHNSNPLAPLPMQRDEHLAPFPQPIIPSYTSKPYQSRFQSVMLTDSPISLSPIDSSEEFELPDSPMLSLSAEDESKDSFLTDSKDENIASTASMPEKSEKSEKSDFPDILPPPAPQAHGPPTKVSSFVSNTLHHASGVGSTPPKPRCPYEKDGFCRSWNSVFHGACDTEKYSHHGQAYPKESDKTTFTTLDAESSEYKTVLNSFLADWKVSLHRPPKVTKIESVTSNTVLQKAFDARIARLKKKCASVDQLRPMRLYHGTRESILDTVCQIGLKPPADFVMSPQCPKYNSNHRSGLPSPCLSTCQHCAGKDTRVAHVWSKCHMYGLGIYFADQSSKADRYVHTESNSNKGKRMLIYDVVPGRVFPAPILNHGPELHDLVLAPDGYDSLMAAGNPKAPVGRGVLNNECTSLDYFHQL